MCKQVSQLASEKKLRNDDRSGELKVFKKESMSKIKDMSQVRNKLLDIFRSSLTVLENMILEC